MLDEPTTALTDAEADHLFAVLAKLKARGRDAALRLAPAARGVPALRPDHRAARRRLCRHLRRRARSRRTASSARWSDAICRRERSTPRGDGAASPALEVRGLTRAPVLSRCVAVGRPRRDRRPVRPRRLRALGAARDDLRPVPRRSAGTIAIGGRPLAAHARRAQAARAGIALVPEERQRQGLFFNLTLRHNLMLPARTVAGDVLIRGRRERADGRAAAAPSGAIKAAGAGRARPTASAAATSRRSCSRSGWRPRRAC